jgi:DNA-binding NarL/FixJ family response regulator
MTRRPRVLLADDHTLLTEALAGLLEPRFEVVGTAADGRALLTMAKELQPDVVLVDIAMPVLDGIQAGRQVREALPACKLIFLTMAQDADLAAEALRIGASAYVLKTSAGWELRRAIDAALRGRTYVTPAVRRHAERKSEDDAEHPSRAGLTARQREVVALLAEGRSMKQVAAALGVTTRTVAFHKYEVMQKFRLGSNAELVQFAIRHGVIKP